MTNDHKHKKKLGGGRRILIAEGSKAVYVDEEIEKEMRLESTPISQLSHEEMMQSLYEKNREKSLTEKAKEALFGKGVPLTEEKEQKQSSWSDTLRPTSIAERSWLGSVKKFMNPVSSPTDVSQNTISRITPEFNVSDFDGKDLLCLSQDLGCRTVTEALQKNIPVDLIGRCIITAEMLKNEGLTIRNLQKFGLTLYDVVEKLAIPWKSMCEILHFNNAHLIRNPNWFDARILAMCCAQQGANLIHDLGFCVEDIFRLRCADYEVSQLNITMQDIFSLGMNRKEFLSLPWALETMTNLLNLTKEQLFFELKLKKKDYKFLFEKRNWNLKFLKEELEFTEEDIQKCGLGFKVSNIQTTVPPVVQRFQYNEPEDDYSQTPRVEQRNGVQSYQNEDSEESSEQEPVKAPLNLRFV